MKINELKDRGKVDELKVRIAGLLPEVIKTKSGSEIQQAIISDGTGQAILKLWNEQIGQYEMDDNIIIKNGYSKLFEKQYEVTTGKFGTIKKNPVE